MSPTARIPVSRIAAALLLAVLAACASPRDEAGRYLREGRARYDAHDLVGARLQARNALQVDAGNAGAYYLLALIGEQEKDYAAVLANLRRAVDADPGYLDARVRLGNYYTVGRRAAEARVQADAALVLAPDNIDVRMLDAWTCYVEGRRDAALQEVAKVLAMDPKRQDATTLGASLHAEAGRFDEAMAQLDRGIAAVGRGPAEGLERVRVAMLLRAGKVALAEQALRRLADEYRGPTYDLALARVYSAQGRPADAEARLRRLVAGEPDNPQWQAELAALLVRQHRSAEAEAGLQQAVAARPVAVPLRLALAGFYESTGRRPEALAAYGALATATPRSAEGLAARNRMVALTVGVDDAKARAQVDAILADVPDNVDALLFRAAFRLQDQRPGDAISDAQVALARDPDSPRVLLFLARAYGANGQAAQAEGSYRRLLDLEPGNEQARNELAAVMAGRGHGDEARALLSDALKINPADPRSSRNLVTLLMAQQDYTAAAAEARRRAGLGDSSGLADYELGAALQGEEHDERAIASYQESLRKDPASAVTLASLVRLLAARRGPADAQLVLEQQLKANPDNVAARLLLGELLRDTGQADAARAQFGRLLDRHKESAGAWMGLASLAPAGSGERLAVLARGHEQLPGDPQLGLALGAAYQQRQEFEKAIAVYDGVLRHGGDNDFVASNLAALLLDVRQDPASWQRALELASRFKGASPHPVNLAVLGWAYYRTGQPAEAVPLLERAVAAEPGLSQLHYWLGMALLKSGNAGRARPELQQAVAAARTQGAPFTGLDRAEAALKSLPAR